ncbi:MULTISPECIES: hypothetical protein [unclassified Variovorax]|uniref:hypothetical protein n=1 Tax=unclassified Variovorax TaxID=663243 RepID=UPI00076D0F76|nr:MULTISPECIES: hypothetical protein [unclassified Variovorax]KWT85732.1 hypothetical protein APY03_3909 [Variovorax sp. WDL1]PNG58361.1 hypothetical protein CHC07_00085 [Variovorax sp. B4]PNG61849.1 hypothetical protein CHC06_01751 [Variovorax sp. B2]VTV12083.1 hypothetical protein WDL1CHR_02913 [Variovorax sp. WDL1]
MKKLVSALCFIVALGAVAGCASSPGAANGERPTIGSSSGVTVFGTIDAAVTGTHNRSSRD